MLCSFFLSQYHWSMSTPCAAQDYSRTNRRFVPTALLFPTHTSTKQGVRTVLFRYNSCTVSSTTLLRASKRRFTKQGLLRTQRRSLFAKELSVLLFGFLSGSLFGTVLTFVRVFLIWDGFIIACLLVVLETTTSLAYTKSPSRSTRTINLFKIGAMIGFFVDAFKVGS